VSIDEFLARNEQKDLLRFSTAGSIDDGKSTLIGRLLHDSKNVYEDHIQSVRKASRERESEEQIDFALLTDGLKAEREQMITIDVAYRYFSTPKRKFIIADTPGHEQYTRNMATGASTANTAIVLVDARKGILPQTKRHAFISSLLGVPHMILAVNKMDLVGYDRSVFESIRKDFEEFAGKLRIGDLRFIPISALKGDNVVNRSSRMPWYNGESLLELLENAYIGSDHNLVDLRFPVQYVIRPDQSFRGYGGQMVSGMLRRGDEVLVLPSMKTSRVKSIVTYDGRINEAFPPMSIAVELEDELDISRGEMLVHRHNLPRIHRHFEAMVVWMSETPMDVDRSYFIKHTTRVSRLRVDSIRYRVDVNTLKREEAAPLGLNEIGRVVFTATNPIFWDPYSRNRPTGSFIIIDAVSNNTVGAGMIIEREPADELPSRMASQQAAGGGLHPRRSLIAPGERVARMGQKAATVWLTGLAGAGKTKLAYEVEQRLFEMGAHCAVLDGENVRLGLSRELDFTAEGRAEHLRRVAEAARLMNEAGLIVICAFLSPEAGLRSQVASIIGRERFLECHVSAPVEWCEANDTSGLYARARAGEIGHLAGVNIPYEPPAEPALVVETHLLKADEAVSRVVRLLRERGIFPLSG
jgi:bifunctional enzyme CysN/CysC